MLPIATASKRSLRGCDISTLSTVTINERPDARGELSLSLDSPRSTRLVGLDMLRGIAILLVASGHMLGAFAIPKDTPTLGRPIWVMMTQLAVAGVDMFLVLSGFLIGGMLLSELRTRGDIAVGR